MHETHDFHVGFSNNTFILLPATFISVPVLLPSTASFSLSELLSFYLSHLSKIIINLTMEIRMASTVRLLKFRKYDEYSNREENNDVSGRLHSPPPLSSTASSSLSVCTLPLPHHMLRLLATIPHKRQCVLYSPHILARFRCHIAMAKIGKL